MKKHSPVGECFFKISLTSPSTIHMKISDTKVSN